MRKYDPADESDAKEAARLEATAWMLEQLKFNPSYVSWGPHEDYMWKRETGDGAGWDAPVTCESWENFGPWSLDEFNEVVNFYFSIGRPSRDCETCGGNGNHPDAQWITESFYRHSSPFTNPDAGEMASKAVLERFGCTFKPGILGRGVLPPEDVINRYGKPFLEFCVRAIENGGEWCDDITEDEAAKLVEEGRGSKREGVVSAADFNRAQCKGGLGLHDAINRWILCRRRCERLRVPYTCPTCEGHGHLFTGPAHLTLTLWVIHPRKGCSRGVEVQHILRDDLPAVYDFLRRAADRNAERFARIPQSRVLS